MAVLVAFGPALDGGFVWDDNRYITQNPVMVAENGLLKIWTDVRALPSPYPLTVSLFYAQFQMWGLNAGGYHAVSLLMHVATVLLVFWLLLRLRVRAAWLAAMLFALHPIQVETVAWISEQKNIFSTLLGVGFLHAWLSHQRNGGWGVYAAAIALFILALFAKTVTQTFVGTAFLIWLLDRKREELHAQIRSWAGLGARIAPFVVISVVFAIATVLWEKKQTGATEDVIQLTANGRLQIAARVPWFYLLKGLWPMDIMAIYPRWDTTEIGIAQIAFMIGTSAALAWAAWGSVARARPCALAAAHFLGSLAPVMGFLNFSTMIHSFAADHYQYVAAMGWMLPLAWLIDALASRAPKAFPFARRIVIGCALASLLVISNGESRHYHDLESLFGRCVSKNPTAWNAHYNVGHALNAEDRLDEALVAYEEALRLNPDFEDAINGIGVLQLKTGDFLSAEKSFRRALEIEPNYFDARQNLIASLLMLGEQEMGANNLASAETRISEALTLDDSSVDALYYMAQLRLRQSRPAEAITVLERALQISPGDEGIIALLNSVRAAAR